MSLLDDDLNMDSTTLEYAILKYIKNNTYLNPHIKWNVIIDDITDYMNNPKSYYLYHTLDSICIYSSMQIRPSNTFSIVNRRYKHINLKHILDYEYIR